MRGMRVTLPELSMPARKILPIFCKVAADEIDIGINQEELKKEIEDKALTRRQDQE